MTETMKALKRDGVQVEKVSGINIRDIFRHLGSGEITKEAVPEIVTWLAKHEGSTVQEATSKIGLKMLSKEELERIIENTVQKNRSLIKERGANAFGAVIGLVMKEVRGKADASVVSELVKKRVERAMRE